MNTRNRGRVVIVQRNMRFDPCSAEEHGEIVYLVENGFSPFNTDQMVETLHRRLAAIDFDPVRDMIAMTGPGVTLAMLMLVVGTLYARVQILIFDARSERYRKRAVEAPAVDVA